MREVFGPTVRQHAYNTNLSRKDRCRFAVASKKRQARREFWEAFAAKHPPKGEK